MLCASMRIEASKQYLQSGPLEVRTFSICGRIRFASHASIKRSSSSGERRMAMESWRMPSRLASISSTAKSMAPVMGLFGARLGSPYFFEVSELMEIMYRMYLRYSAKVFFQTVLSFRYQSSPYLAGRIFSHVNFSGSSRYSFSVSTVQCA